MQPTLTKAQVTALVAAAIAAGQPITVYAPSTKGKAKRKPYKAPPKPATFTPA